MFSQKINLKKTAILLSFVLGFVLMLVKFWAYTVTESKSIFTDAVESIVNIVASGFAFYSLYLAEQPKDQNHPYGHGKIEFFSAGFEGVLILIAGVFTLIPAIQSFYHGNFQVLNINIGIITTLVVLILNGSLGLWLKKIGKSENSIILNSEGKHLVLDAISSGVIIIGLILVKLTGFEIIDPILAVLLAMYIFYNGYSLLRQSVGGLMDETDYDLINSLISVLKTNRKNIWIDIHNFRVQKYGSDIHIDCHLTLPYYLTLKESHEEVSNFEKVIKSNNEVFVEIFVHSDPCLPKCCIYCKVQNCPVRSEENIKEVIWDVETLIKDQKHFEY